MCKSDTHILIDKVNLTVRNGNIKTAFERLETDVLICMSIPLFFTPILIKETSFRREANIKMEDLLPLEEIPLTLRIFYMYNLIFLEMMHLHREGGA